MVSIEKIFKDIGIKKIAHVAIAVKSIDESGDIFARILGNSITGLQTLPERGLRIGFFQVGEGHLELLEPLEPDNTVSRFIEKRGEGLHHIAFEVEDLTIALKELKSRGIRLVDEEPRKGAHDTLVAFLHPASTSGVLIELIQVGSEEKS